MRKSKFLIAGIVFLLCSLGRLNAQTDLVGNWELYKIVKLPSDTQLVKQDDPRYLKYNFNYNNTFSCFHRKENEEATGKWGFDRKENALKIRAQTFTKSKATMEDFDLKLLQQINKVMFIQVICDKKNKPLEYHIFRKI
ncbi:MAG: hypothetical protein ACJ76F_03505 [Bacteroidia bacterium]